MFGHLSNLETGFLYIAIISTILFFVQSLFTFLDLGDNFEMDSNFDGHVDIGMFHGFGLPFNLFTLRGIIGFFVLFGWTGFMFDLQGLPIWLVFVLAAVCGFVMMFIISMIYYFTYKMSDSGNVDLKSAIGRPCEVYIPIPGNNQGTGKVSIILGNSLKEFDAVTNKNDLASGEVVVVVDVLNDKLVVEKNL